MIFIKPDDVLFNCQDLEDAIKLHTDSPKEKYKITIRNLYPCLCIGHDHYYVHRLLGELYFGDITNCLIHHINGIKTDNSRENLQKITNSEHTSLHHRGNDFRSKDCVARCINAMANKRRRKDITSEEVKKLRDSGMTYKELKEYFNCGNSVIANRLNEDGV